MSSNISIATMEQELLDQLIAFGHDYRALRYTWVMSLALLIYDLCLTFDKEVKYIWCKRFTWTRVLFCWNRYWPIANLIFDNIVLAIAHGSEKKVCTFWLNFLVYSQVPYEAAICAVYILRLYAMYGRNRAFLITLCVIYSFVLVNETTIISLIVHDPRFIELPVAMFTGCLPTNLKPYAWTFWLPMLTFEGIIFFLSLWRVVRIAREGIKTPDLVIALARDSVIYFGGVLIAILINVIVWKTASEALFVAFLPIAIASFSIFGSRLLLNMQAAAEPSYRLHYLVTSGLTAYTGALESHPLPSIEFGDLSSGGESSNADA